LGVQIIAVSAMCTDISEIIEDISRRAFEFVVCVDQGDGFRKGDPHHDVEYCSEVLNSGFLTNNYIFLDVSIDFRLKIPLCTG